VVIFEFIGTITLGIFGFMNTASKGYIFLSPTILVLGDARIHVCTLYSGNIHSNVEQPVDKAFSIYSTLSISYINPHYSYI